MVKSQQNWTTRADHDLTGMMIGIDKGNYPKIDTCQISEWIKVIHMNQFISSKQFLFGAEHSLVAQHWSIYKVVHPSDGVSQLASWPYLIAKVV